MFSMHFKSFRLPRLLEDKRNRCFHANPLRFFQTIGRRLISFWLISSVPSAPRTFSLLYAEPTTSIHIEVVGRAYLGLGGQGADSALPPAVDRLVPTYDAEALQRENGTQSLQEDTPPLFFFPPSPNPSSLFVFSV